jgi:hypothetical protein
LREAAKEKEGKDEMILKQSNDEREEKRKKSDLKALKVCIFMYVYICM